MLPDVLLQSQVRYDHCKIRSLDHALRRMVRGVGRVHKLRVETESHMEMIDVTAGVRRLVKDAGVTRGMCHLYVPHTTAGVTINEKIDPALVDDFEQAFRRIVGEEWEWRHNDADGPNAPAHVRASLVSPQVLVPLNDGQLALGTYQGIFFCEFDGPRERSVYVSVLQLARERFDQTVAPQQQAAGQVADHGDVGILHRADDPLRHLVLVEGQRVVDRGHRVIERG